MDFIKRFFNFKPPESNFGQSGLPQNVEDDLRSKMINPEEEKRKSYDRELIGNQQRFWVIQEFDQFFKDIFEELNSGKFQIPFYPLEDQNKLWKENEDQQQHQPTDEGDLRNKMLEITPNENNNGKHKEMIISPFFGDDASRDEDEFKSFFFNLTPFFQNPQQQHGIESLEEDEDIMEGSRSPFSMFPWKPFFFNKDFVPGSHGDKISSAFKYSTVTKKVNPDGSVETKTTRRDSDGNIEETVTRSINGQIHTVVKKENKNGDSETKENYINMDEQDLQKFEERWKEKKKDELRKDLFTTSPKYDEEEV